MERSTWKFVLCFIFCLICIPFGTAHAVQLQFAWDAPAPCGTPDTCPPDGYRLKGRTTSGSYDATNLWTGTALTATVPGISNSATTVFTVRGYNAQGESGNSNEVSWTPPTIVPSLTTLTNTINFGGTAPTQTFTVKNGVTQNLALTIPVYSTLTYTISSNQTWLTVSPTTGTSTGEADTITVTYNTASLAVGSYNATITVADPNASNASQTIGVSLTVTSNKPNTPSNLRVGGYTLQRK